MLFYQFPSSAGMVTGDGTGDVVGPGGAVDSNFAAFAGPTGKLLKDSAVPLTSLRQITSLTKTADYTVDVGDSGTHFDNVGAAGDIVLSLPIAARGLIFRTTVAVAHYIKLLAFGTNTISIGNDKSAAGGYVRSNLPGCTIELKALDATGWVTSSREGPWSIDS